MLRLSQEASTARFLSVPRVVKTSISASTQLFTNSKNSLQGKKQKNEITNTLPTQGRQKQAETVMPDGQNNSVFDDGIFLCDCVLAVQLAKG